MSEPVNITFKELDKLRMREGLEVEIYDKKNKCEVEYYTIIGIGFDEVIKKELNRNTNNDELGVLRRFRDYEIRVYKYIEEEDCIKHTYNLKTKITLETE